MIEALAKFRKPLACGVPPWARLIIPPLKQQPLLSRDREGVVLFARFIGFLQVPHDCLPHELSLPKVVRPVIIVILHDALH
jgi:hypothetical protein